MQKTTLSYNYFLVNITVYNFGLILNSRALLVADVQVPYILFNSFQMIVVLDIF